MAKGDSGLQDQILKADPLLGLTDFETVMLDLDDMSYESVQDWANSAMKRFRLKGYIILRSSENCYHVVLDRYVSREENMSIMAWIAILSKSLKLKDYVLMQFIKMGSTLRVIPKEEKPSPRIIYRFGSQENAIKDFLRHRQLIKRIYRSIR